MRDSKPREKSKVNGAKMSEKTEYLPLNSDPIRHHPKASAGQHDTIRSKSCTGTKGDARAEKKRGKPRNQGVTATAGSEASRIRQVQVWRLWTQVQ